MSEPAFTSRVTLDKDGVYRWYYDLDMFRNRYLLNVMLKLTGAICAGVYFLLVLLLDEGGPLVASEPWKSLRTQFLLLLPFLGVMLLVITGYCIAAAVKRGKYRLQFEMTEERIRLVRKQSTQEFVNDSWLKPRACSYPVVRTKAEPSPTFVTSKLADAASRGG